MEKCFRTKFIILVGVMFFTLPFFAEAVSYSYGHQQDFYLDSNYDKSEREEISATIRYISSRAYFYIENEWWDDLTSKKKQEYKIVIKNLAKEFDNNIYPVLTSLYGHEWKPGIDKDYRTTVLFGQTKEDIAGYFRSIDEYRKIQAPESNEKEMVYLSTRCFDSKNISSYLAHEFTHLITFNQKNRKQEQDEDIWLNELRAEYSPTLLGYDDEFDGSNLETRIRYFVTNPSDSLTEWKNETRDYGITNLFGQYLVEQFGTDILSQSMASPYVGVASLNYALSQAGVDKDLFQVFSDMMIAVSLNDCSLGKEYCFEYEPLSYLRIAPSLIYLPSTQEANLSLVYAVKEWSGHWYKIIGGGKGLKIEFKSLSDGGFIIPYFIQQSNKTETVKFLELDENYEGVIELPYFSENHQSMTIIPTIFEKTSDFSDKEPFSRFSLEISTFENGEEEQEGQEEIEEIKPIAEITIEQLKVKIAEIMAQIQLLLVEIDKIKADSAHLIIPSGFNFNQSLRIGMSSVDVKYLQIVLNSDSETRLTESGVGSPGQETIYFGPLTKSAVVKFQEKYADEILTPWGLSVGNGFVGTNTREKLNSLLKEFKNEQ